jgi:hypothetical protein
MMRVTMFSILAATILQPLPAAAQVRASELGLVQQTIDGTKITIEYSRPAARGRTPFGGVVHWGERWTPGANWATTLETDHDIRLAGHAIPKGKYSLWMIVRANNDWSLFVHPKHRVYHTQRPDTTEAITRIPIKPDSGPHLERLTFSFPTITPEGGVLELHWGTTVVQLPVRVPASRPMTLSASAMRNYAGVYALTFFNRSVRMDVFEQDGKLRGMLRPNPMPYDSVFDLLPTSKDRFSPLFYKAGQPFDLEDFAVVFIQENGRITSAEWRGINERVTARGAKQ